ncbi:5-oxoprolinase/urea amidolyase family protein [Pseudomonas sp. DTU_2021_1001937_2_SI_NGA_ILE_001]|uniref:5-oxoprolinase subunit B/C family protein n=1 Tax=Pseudomonas sp. DTU_2021_1001937_2_SI_NGA_ILE_001 TaxID=3077589 RepID=UPI0028FC1464|nr:5-oxoprolinase/urea amidolyase family protein [Pseudomonas sp. DTU_2021_1001937_2_SI_NGA_ILE_001]WNW13038.1 5-oxoprolinase/urea amidolyase family protein [Pseudomonas sp. DTU_2021_1001937_2_SI_NGA_ILE_001]
MRFYPVNLDALLVELANLDETLALFDSLQQQPIAGVQEIVPAARTLLVQFRPGAIGPEALAAQIAARDIHGPARQAGRLVEIPVHYNGEDLQDVARELDISVEEVIRRHTGSDYNVAFCGFAPGFAYLSGGAGFVVPRRSTPRTRIPAGAVALAGGFSGIYPQASPGGWQIIGVTPLKMWDLQRDEAALLKPGYRVRFQDAGRLPTQSVTVPVAERQPAAPVTGDCLEILSPGLQTLLQDLGRPGRAGEGISASGAMDRGALRSANRAVGNDPGTACLEILMGGLSFTCHGQALVALTGAEAAIEVRSAEGQVLHPPLYQPFALHDGDRVSIGSPSAGLRNYLAVRGGFSVAPILGSLSTDTLAQVGPAPLASGDRLGFERQPGGRAVSLSEQPAFAMPRRDQLITLDVVMGPRSDWFTPAALALLAEQTWQVTPQSNRIGIRLAGEQSLERAVGGELPSEGTVVGAIQVPPSGQPVLFLADHPLTGGYPVIGAVASHHLDLAGQIPVNARIRFNPLAAFEPVLPVSPDETQNK